MDSPDIMYWGILQKQGFAFPKHPHLYGELIWMHGIDRVVGWEGYGDSMFA